MSTSHDTGSGTIKKFDPENMGIAIGILLLCAVELEICLGVKYPPAASKRRQKTAAGTRVNGNPSQNYGVSLAIWDHTMLLSTQHKRTQPDGTSLYARLSVCVSLYLCLYIHLSICVSACSVGRGSV